MKLERTAAIPSSLGGLGEILLGCSEMAWGSIQWTLDQLHCLIAVSFAVPVDSDSYRTCTEYGQISRSCWYLNCCSRCVHRLSSCQSGRLLTLNRPTDRPTEQQKDRTVDVTQNFAHCAKLSGKRIPSSNALRSGGRRCFCGVAR